MTKSTQVDDVLGTQTHTPQLGRITKAFLDVMEIFVETPKQKYTGAEIRVMTDRKAGTVYPLLSRMVTRGWLTSEWEPIDPEKDDRPPRRLYSVTDGGLARAKTILKRQRTARASTVLHTAQA